MRLIKWYLWSKLLIVQMKTNNMDLFMWYKFLYYFRLSSELYYTTWTTPHKHICMHTPANTHTHTQPTTPLHTQTHNYYNDIIACSWLTLSKKVMCAFIIYQTKYKFLGSTKILERYNKIALNFIFSVKLNICMKSHIHIAYYADCTDVSNQ